MMPTRHVARIIRRQTFLRLVWPLSVAQNARSRKVSTRSNVSIAMAHGRFPLGLVRLSCKRQQRKRMPLPVGVPFGASFGYDRHVMAVLLVLAVVVIVLVALIALSAWSTARARRGLVFDTSDAEQAIEEVMQMAADGNVSTTTTWSWFMTTRIDDPALELIRRKCEQYRSPELVQDLPRMAADLEDILKDMRASTVRPHDNR